VPLLDEGEDEDGDDVGGDEDEGEDGVLLDEGDPELVLGVELPLEKLPLPDVPVLNPPDVEVFEKPP
jgi:hypothetical protein